MDRSTIVLAFIGGLIAALLIVLIVVLLTGDDGGGSAPAADSSSTTEATTTSEATTTAPSTTSSTTTAPPTTSAPSTTAAASSTTGAPAGRCDGLAGTAIPGGVSLLAANGNFDGPPEPESIMESDLGFVFEDGGHWYVGFSLNSGYIVYEQMPDPGPADFEPEVSVWNFDGDDGLLVYSDFSLMSGAMVYTMYYLDEDCQIDDAGTADSDPIELLDWAGAVHTQAFTCVSDGIYLTSAGETAPNNWDVRSAFYEWTAPEGPGFVFGFEDGMEVPADDPEVTNAGVVDC